MAAQSLFEHMTLQQRLYNVPRQSLNIRQIGDITIVRLPEPFAQSAINIRVSPLVVIRAQHELFQLVFRHDPAVNQRLEENPQLQAVN